MLAYAITTCNEVSNITECIASLRQAGVSAHMVYVIDSVSNDGTQNLALSVGATVLENPFTDMAAQRNFAFAEIALREPSIHFVCILDADERVSLNFHSELTELLERCGTAAKKTAVAVCRKMIFNGHWVKRASNFPVYIDRVGHIRSTTWKNVGHGEILVADVRHRVASPLSEEDNKGIESLLRRHVTYARNEAHQPITGGKQSWLKERALALRGSHVFVIIYALYLFLGRGILFRDRRERDYALIKIIYELQIVLFKRYN